MTLRPQSRTSTRTLMTLRPGRDATMRGAILCGSLVLLLASCSWLPRAGPSGSEVEAQAATGDQGSFDIVKVDDAVTRVLRARGQPGFPELLKKSAPPPQYKIAV